MISHEAVRSGKAKAAKMAEVIKCQEDLDQARLHGDSMGEVTNLIKLAELDPEARPEQKQGYYQKALVTAQSSGDLRLETIANLFLARFLFNQADFRGADLYYQTVMTLAQQHNDPQAHALIENELRQNHYQLEFMEMVKKAN